MSGGPRNPILKLLSTQPSVAQAYRVSVPTRTTRRAVLEAMRDASLASYYLEHGDTLYIGWMPLQ